MSRRAMARVRQALRVVLVAGACASATAPAPAVRADAGSPRTIVIISDLHLGVGKDPATGDWHAFEDFRWAPEFTRFLAAVNKAGSGRTDLVLNGDTFELWQSLRDDCTVADVGCSEADARRRIGHVIAQHRDELDALADFARAGENTVTIVPGNHDAALLFPAVAAAVVDALAVPAPRVRVELRGSWISPDGLVYAEHGHQIGHEVNRFEGWPTPFVERGQRFLRRPWGEQFVQAFYNDFERRYPSSTTSPTSVGAIRSRHGGGGSPADRRGQLWSSSSSFSWTSPPRAARPGARGRGGARARVGRRGRPGAGQPLHRRVLPRRRSAAARGGGGGERGHARPQRRAAHRRTRSG